MAKNGINKDTVPENFTIGLALVDFLPVLFFGVATVIFGIAVNSPVFLSGAFLCFAGGLIKVIWKIIVVIKKKNIWWMFVQMRAAMPAGFVLMIIGGILSIGAPAFTAAVSAAVTFPAILFLLMGIFGLVLMIVFASVLDSADVKSNWIEQGVNAAGQLCFLIGVLLII